MPLFLWDRLGHWAQDEDNWEDAANAYGKAHELEPEEHYGYCYGMALNYLGRFTEALRFSSRKLKGFNPTQ